MVKLQNEFDVVVDWRGFELHPETPKGGRSVESLFGTARRAEFKTYMSDFAARFQVSIGSPEHIPNTKKALAMTEYARDHDLLTAFREATMAAHWVEGKNIESDDVLHTLAASVGLNAHEALKASDSSFYLKRVDDLQSEAKENRITGIPTIVFGEQRIVGCQTYDVIRARLEAEGIPKR